MENAGIVTFPGIRLSRCSLFHRGLGIIRTNIAVNRLGKGSIVPSRSLTVDALLGRSNFSHFRLACRRTVTCLHGRTVALSTSIPHNCVLLACGGVPLKFTGGVNGQTGGLCPRR